MVDVWTATLRYGGPGRLDVTRKGSHPLGIAFAPSVDILHPILSLRSRCEGLKASLPREQLVALWHEIWSLYAGAYRAEMRVSYGSKTTGVAWAHVLGWKEVTFCCFCPNASFCHRTVLAQIFGTLRGVQLRGERPPPKAAGAP
jgi:hypothetical protein